jgi:voltage-gated potassium channel
MTDSQHPVPESWRVDRPTRRVILRSVLRATGSIAAFVAIYYALPLATSATWAAVIILVGGLIGFIALVTYQIRSILRSAFPGLRAIEALATSIPLFLVLFAGSYVVMAHLSGASFSQPMTHTDGLYFTVTVFSTVGFGDIVPRTEAARILVTVQMIADIVVIGLAIQAIIASVRQALQRRSAKP